MFGWIPVLASTADVKTKLNSSLKDQSALTLVSSKVQVDFDKIETAFRHHMLGCQVST